MPIFGYPGPFSQTMFWLVHAETYSRDLFTKTLHLSQYSADAARI